MPISRSELISRSRSSHALAAISLAACSASGETFFAGDDTRPFRGRSQCSYVLQRADVEEEMDRLEAHLDAIKTALTGKVPCGRKLDFLMQELNREANTLASKSTALDTTNTAIEFKVLIEQMREQIQNIE